MVTQATRKLRLAAEKFGKALAWFERGATAGKLTINAHIESALKEKKSEKQQIELLKDSRRRSTLACTATAERSSTRHG